MFWSWRQSPFSYPKWYLTIPRNFLYIVPSASYKTGHVSIVMNFRQQKEKKRWAVKEKPWGNAHHLETIPYAINSSDRSARRMSGETKRMCINLSQLFSYWLRRKSDMSDGKEAQMVRTSLEYPEPSQLLPSIPLLGPTDRGGVLRYPSCCVSI